jgi:tetratricopeptide (TPR) repeat protein
MFDFREALDSFKPINLEMVEERSGKLPENISEAIKLFNKALEDIRFKSEDMAIIALKKAISLHPVFYEAMNLLGVCYAMTGREDAAKAAFQKVIDDDDSSIKAMEYMKKLQPQSDEDIDTGVPKKRIKKGEKKKSNLVLLLEKALKREDKKLYYLKYVVGFVAGILVTSFIWYMVPTGKSLFSFDKIETIDKNPELEEKINVLNERIEKLELDLRERNDENLKLMDSFQAYKEWMTRLNEAAREYNNGNYIQSADLLFNAQENEVPEELYEYYRNLWDEVRLEAAEALYNEANKIYNNNRNKDPEVYKQALEKYETCLLYIENDRVSYKSSLYYQAGKAAARCDEKDRAVELFELIVNEYPNSSMSSYAINRLNELRAGREIGGS